MRKFPLKLPLVLDGATGTHLFELGLKLGECPESWILKSADNSEAVIALQTEYYKAGSDIVLAPTFGANPFVLKRYSLDKECEEMNKRLTALTVEARERYYKCCGRDKKVYIAGDISPSGRFLLPYGETGFDELVSSFTRQAIALDEAGADLFVIETQVSLSEARAALYAVKSITEKPVFVTVTIDENGATLSGEPSEACLISLSSAGADAFGINCSRGADEMLPYIKRLCETRAEGYPLIAKPNGGLPNASNIKQSETGEDFCCSAANLYTAGAAIVGGCCGTGPEHIALLSKKIKSLKETMTHSDSFKTLASNAGIIYDISKMPLSPEIVCGIDLGDIAAEYDGCVALIRINSENDADELVEALPFLTGPVMFISDSFIALKRAFAVYPGRAALSGGSNITESERERLIAEFSPAVTDGENGI
ncbi:MAG: homocysteine S-methyltransferase family protein [Oscillospiraceae bacterium]|nr:homocysteine S-methyltransferase family protein [Oscillospiraceae bacterium]